MQLHFLCAIIYLLYNRGAGHTISAALALLETDEQRNILSEFYEENKNRFYAIAFSKLHNREAAEDAIQEAFLRIVRYPDKFFEIDAHKRLPYAIIIIRNVVLQFLEQKGRYEPEELPEELPDPGISVEETVIGRISGDELMEFINSLPEAQKQAIILKSVYGLNYREIADTLGITEAAVRRRISDAYGRIRGYIKEGE